MATGNVVIYRFVGLSSDTKPTVAPNGTGVLTYGSTFYAKDTDALSFWNGSAWVATTTSDQKVGIEGSVSLGGGIFTGNYETVAASQTGQVLGGAGATGDYLCGLLVIPATTSPEAIALLDGATSINVFAGGANSVSNLVPFFIPAGVFSVNGAWSLTTGANVSVIASGKFT